MPAVAGMISGIGLTSIYIVACVFWKMPPWSFGLPTPGINPQAVGFIGMLVNFAVTLSLTPFFPPPSEQTKALVDAVREPEDAMAPVDIESAPEH